MRFSEVEAALLGGTPARMTFDPSMVDELPGPAARLLRHAIAPGAALATRVHLRQSGSLVQGGRRLPLTAEEVLAPLRGFVWSARGRLGPITLRVRDHYLTDDGGVDVRVLGIPLGGERGPDTAISSRGRLAAESLWVPSMLLPRPGVQWVAMDENRVRLDLTIDGSSESIMMTVDPDGRITELAMQRWGDVGVPRHQRIPYGFRVLAERTFDGYTIAAQVEGGWWYGTERFDAAAASRFLIQDAQYR
jgi:hypothetical protein